MIELFGVVDFEKTDWIDRHCSCWAQIGSGLWNLRSPRDGHMGIAFRHVEWAGTSIESIRIGDNGSVRLCHAAAEHSMHPFDLSIRYHQNPSLVQIEMTPPGLRPVYYWWHQSVFVYSTDFSMLRRVVGRGTPDPVAAASMIGLGRIIGDRTHVHEIRRLPPGTHHAISASGIDSFFSESDSSSTERPSTPQECAEIFRTSLANCLRSYPGEPWIPLSGGVDSRTILAASAQSGLKAYTRGSDRCMDVEVARRAAEICSIPHRSFELPPHYFEEYADRIIGITAGAVSIDDSHAIFPCTQLAETGVNAVIPGIGGEYGRNFWKRSTLSFADSIESTVPELSSDIFRTENKLERKRNFARVMKSQDFQHILANEYARSFASAACNVRFPDPLATLDEFYLHNRTRHFTIFGPLIWGRYFDVFLPFLDTNYLNAIRALPCQFRRSSNVHSTIIQSRHPELMKLRLVPSGQIPENGFKQPDHHGWVSKIRRSLGRTNRMRSYATLLRKNHRFVQELLENPDSDLAQIVSYSEIRKAWSMHRLGMNNAQLIARFLTLSLLWR